MPSGGCQKRQKALKTLRFLYGGSSIHWPPKPILSSSIFSHLFPFNFFPLYLRLNLHLPYIFSSPLHIFLLLKNFLHTQIFSIIPNSTQFVKKFFYLPAKIPRILYHLPSINPLILSLNKYYLSRIILEISLQLSHENYFPELLNPHLTILTYYVIIYYGNRYRLAYGLFMEAKGQYIWPLICYISPFGASQLYYSAKTSLKSLLKCLPIKLHTEHIRIDSRPKNVQYMSRKWNTAPFPLPPITSKRRFYHGFQRNKLELYQRRRHCLF